MADFGPETTVREVLERRPEGRQLLFAHGYDIGEGFVDVLSQYQTLRDAAHGGRLRNLEGLLQELNDRRSG
jgi:hypothetical protein